MLAPPPGQFTNCKELLAYVRTFARAQGYAVTIKRSRSDEDGRIKNMLLQCDRGGSYRNQLNLTTSSRCRQTASRLSRCPFELYESRRNNIWFLEVRDPNHNHEASVNMSGHPIVRRLNAEQLEQVRHINAASSRSR
ncbi:15592_t:CDS:1 [Cetraspora pellucida]|uniref:15592_t:CDS:1 n=1 Tax=Cetraspora pellucida TaxID=1433469 RepID=A0A9N9FX48_9GLOM|nr:15592_t:CDS:1 [Cetraspora pellucida]